MILKMHKDIMELLNSHKIETNVEVRWQNGTGHHPESEKIMKFIMAVDFEMVDDYFCWKKGGDGDNGETLMYELDMWFELQDSIKKMNEPLGVL